MWNKIILIVTLEIGLVCCSVVVRPRNTAVIAGHELEFECKTNDSSQHVNRWTVQRASTRNSPVDTLYVKRQVQGVTFFGFQYDNGVLLKNETNVIDAGLYTCYANNDEARFTAQLIVWGSVPLCESNISTDGYAPFEYQSAYIWMQCTLNYSGYWPPIMEWRMHDNEKQEEDGRESQNDSSTITTSTSVTSSLLVSLDSVKNGSHFTCKTYFAQYSGSVQMDASNIPEMNYTWNSSVVVFIEATHSTMWSMSATTLQVVTHADSSSITNADVSPSSSSYWFSVSLCLVAVVSIISVMMGAMALKFYFCRKRGTEAVPSVWSNDRTTGNAEFNPYDTIDGGYAKIDSYDDSPKSIPKREGTLPTPGYDHLLPRTATLPYDKLPDYLQPMDLQEMSQITADKA